MNLRAVASGTHPYFTQVSAIFRQTQGQGDATGGILLTAGREMFHVAIVVRQAAANA